MAKAKKNKVGVKLKLTVDEKMLAEVKILAGRGLTNEQIHTYYGVKKDCWYNAIKRHPELAEAFREGKAKTIAMVTGELMKAIHAGNITAIIFYLKTQAQWSDKPLFNVTDTEKLKISYSIGTTDPVEAARIYQQIMTGS